MYKKKAGGYMTLEASMIMPWVIFLMIFLIYMSFYFYDKCVLFQDVYALCFRGSVQKEEARISEYITEHMKEQFGSKYFGVGTVTGSVKQSAGSVKVLGMCSVKMPFHHFLVMDKRGGWELQTEAEAQIMNPAKIIRRCRMAEKVLEYGKDMLE